MRHKVITRMLFTVILVLGSTGCPKKGETGDGQPGGIEVVTVDTIVFNLFFRQSIPHPGIRVQGNWQQDKPGAVGSGTNQFGFDITTGFSTGKRFVTGARRPATWLSTVYWTPICVFDLTETNLVAVETPPYTMTWECRHPPIVLRIASKQFVTSDAVPATFTSGADGLTVQDGYPLLNVYDGGGNHVSQTVASQVPPDGSAATFPFPRRADGQPLPSGFYVYNILNRDNASAQRRAALGNFSVGSNDTSRPAPFGVDAVEITPRQNLASTFRPTPIRILILI